MGLAIETVKAGLPVLIDYRGDLNAGGVRVHEHKHQELNKKLKAIPYGFRGEVQVSRASPLERVNGLTEKDDY